MAVRSIRSESAENGRKKVAKSHGDLVEIRREGTNVAKYVLSNRVFVG